jgi:hypothetical protein
MRRPQGLARARSTSKNTSIAETSLATVLREPGSRRTCSVREGLIRERSIEMQSVYLSDESNLREFAMKGESLKPVSP